MLSLSASTELMDVSLSVDGQSLTRTIHTDGANFSHEQLTFHVKEKIVEGSRVVGLSESIASSEWSLRHQIRVKTGQTMSTLKLVDEEIFEFHLHSRPFSILIRDNDVTSLKYELSTMEESVEDSLKDQLAVLKQENRRLREEAKWKDQKIDSLTRELWMERERNPTKDEMDHLKKRLDILEKTTADLMEQSEARPNVTQNIYVKKMRVDNLVHIREQMVQYKLTYFPIRGRAEVARQLLSLAGQEFEDVRLSDGEWEKQKNDSPFGQLPVLEVDGEKIAQSDAINRYLAKTFGFAGKTAWEEAIVDSLADQWKDFSNEILHYFRVWAGKVEGDKDALEKDVFIPANMKIFGFFGKFLENGQSGFLIGDSVTWIDLHVAEYVSLISTHAPELAKAFPKFIEHKDKINSLPAIANWIKTRPETAF